MLEPEAGGVEPRLIGLSKDDTFVAPYMSWGILAFSMLLGNSTAIDTIGIMVGHIYYFMEYMYPTMSEILGWQTEQLMEPPWLTEACLAIYKTNTNCDKDLDGYYLNHNMSGCIFIVGL